MTGKRRGVTFLAAMLLFLLFLNLSVRIYQGFEGFLREWRPFRAFQSERSIFQLNLLELYQIP